MLVLRNAAWIAMFGLTSACLAADVKPKDPAGEKTTAAEVKAPTKDAPDPKFKEAEGKLKDKGLVKQGGYWVLPDEAVLSKGLMDIRKMKSDMDKADGELDRSEKLVTKIKNYVAGLELDMRKTLEQLQPGITVQENNTLVAKLKVAESKIKQVVENDLRAAQGKHDTLNNTYIKTRQEYVEKSTSLAATADKTEAKYAELAKDADVTGALEALAGDKGKNVLGPSTSFKTSQAALAQTSKAIQSDAIVATVQGNVAMVDTIINGSVKHRMVFDSGAGMVAIPHSLAQSLSLIPSKDTQVIRMQLADGKIVEAHLMTLKSLQVGPFTVENVECAVLPEKLVAAPALLGGTFLKHFIYKVDLKNGKIDMSRVKTDDVKKK